MNQLKTQLKILRLITEEPLNSHQKWKAVLRYFGWQLIKRTGLVLPYTFFENCRIRVRHGYTNSAACAYVGLPEFECKAFVLHLLRPGDVMADAGANVGVYSILAAKACGVKVLAFEPEPSTFAELNANVELNNISEFVKTFEVGLADEAGKLFITTGHGVQNHLLIEEIENEPSVSIDVFPLDDFCETDIPILVKIDVEGSEAVVIYGALITLANPSVKAVILERMGLGQRYGFDEDEVHADLLKLGFKCFSYQPFRRQLIPVEKTTIGNYFYIRDLPFVKKRLETAGKHTCHGKEF